MVRKQHSKSDFLEFTLLRLIRVIDGKYFDFHLEFTWRCFQLSKESLKSQCTF